jgi:uncharacterized protein with HEPN domain
MRHPERIEDYLGHIAQAIERARSYVQPSPDLYAFEQNPLVQDAVVRNIEIIGETVNQISRMPLSSSLSIRSSDGRICATCAMSLLTPISR